MAKMRLSLRNVGMINKADIEIGGLTIIAGKNNCGKSTVGRVLFSIITAINEYKNILDNKLNIRLSKQLDYLYSNIRRALRESNYSIFNDELRIFLPNTFYQDIEVDGFKTALERRTSTLSNLLNNDAIKKEQYDNLKSILDKLPEIFPSADRVEEILRRTIEKVFYSEFLGDINKNMPNLNNLPMEIVLSFDDITQISIKQIKDTQVEVDKNINSMEELMSIIPLKDATIIESPLVLNLSSSIFASDAIVDKENSFRRSILNIRGIVQLHIIDLMRKIRDSMYGNIANDFDIAKTIGGRLKYDKESNSFIYMVGKRNFNAINTASGIKSFGILQMLLGSQVLNEKSFLILDEPEVHLHPEWQVKYAEILVKMVKKYSIPILVTTHSPYMLQALEIYAKKYKIKPNPFIYHTYTNKDDLYVFKDVSNDLSPIYKDLLTPIDELEFIQYKLGKKVNEKQ